MPEPIATWNSARGVWERAELNMLCGHAVPFSETFPTSGTWDASGLYPLPMPGLRTVVSGCSSSPGLLPTPDTGHSLNGHGRRGGRPGNGHQSGEGLEHVVSALASPELLPTPQVAYDGRSPEAWQEAKNRAARKHQEGAYAPGTGAPGMMDLQRAMSLLRTPTAQLAVNGGSQHPDKRKAGGHGPTLADQVEHELLPTPQAHDAVKGKTPEQVEAMRERGRTRGHMPGVSNLNEVVENGLLPPTPSVADGTGGHKTRSGSRKGEPLLGGIAMLLPTPTAMHTARNATANRSEDKQGTNNDGWTLADVFWTGDLTPESSNDGSGS